MNIGKLRITLIDGGSRYNAEAIEHCGRYYYRVGNTTIEVTKNEYDRVVANPRLYYFQTALKLHNAIKKGLRKNVRLSESHDMITNQDARWSRLLKHLERLHSQGGADVEDCTFVEAAPTIERVLTWGILNPLGPTVASLCLAADPSGNAKVIFVKTSNPFANSTTAVGVVSTALSEDDLLQVVAEATTKGGTSRILRCAPSFVIPRIGGLMQRLGAFGIVYRNVASLNNIDLASEIDRLRRFWLNPWARLPSMEAMLVAARSGQRSVQSKISKALFSKWWPLVTDPEHLGSEWRAIIEAWQGAVGFQGDSPTAEIAIPAQEALAFHTRLLAQEKHDASYDQMNETV
jgi:hypothetical protein